MSQKPNTDLTSDKIILPDGKGGFQAPPNRAARAATHLGIPAEVRAWGNLVQELRQANMTVEKVRELLKLGLSKEAELKEAAEQETKAVEQMEMPFNGNDSDRKPVA